MKLERIIIDNFRNIEHAEYDLARVNLWTGPNQLGKTNTILGVYWALTDFLMDGSSDFTSLKPMHDQKATVSVELVFDSFTLKKTYKEKWTKARGSGETAMTGHETTYYIDGIKTAITAAKKEITAKLGLGGIETGGFDLLRAVVDPHYFAEAADWKTLRAFIIQICGDVSNEDVFASDPTLESIKPRLETDGYDTSKSTKYFNQQIKNLNKDIRLLQANAEGIRNATAKPSDTDVEMAKKSIEDINRQMEDLKNASGEAAKEKKLAEIQKEINDASLSLRESQVADKETTMQANAGIDAEIARIQASQNGYRQQFGTVEQAYQSAKDALSKAKADLNGIEYRKQQAEFITRAKQSAYDGCGQTYIELLNWQKPEGEKCPHCGGILNQDWIDRQVQQHETDVANAIEAGKAARVELDTAKADLESVTMELEEAKGKLTSLEDAHYTAEAAYTEAYKRMQGFDSQIAGLRQKYHPGIISDKTKHAQAALDNAKQKYKSAMAIAADAEGEKDRVMANLEIQKLTNQSVLDALAAYSINQKAIKSINDKIAAAQKELVAAEQAIIALKRFIQVKLQLFQANISKVFGDRMQFNLIQENIKAGSWDEICQPCVIGKDTPVSNASGSEQILTGIYFAECVKKSLGIPDLPYIFDECDKLDSAHLKAIDTKSQILSTIVDDINYSTITLIKEG